MAEIYTVGWAHLAQTALHAEFLKQFGATFNNPKLLEAAGRVDRLAANWTAFRIFGAHGAHGGIELETAVSEIEKRVSGFISDHERALDTIEDAVKSF